MLRPALFGFVTSVLGRAVQAPLDSTPPWQSEQLAQSQAILGQDHWHPAEWDVLQLPNPNHTDHLVFETVHSLLQHWPNTRMRNGHNIVPGVIPKGTPLYHGRSDETLPQGPEWTSLDAEHAYYFCQDRTYYPSQDRCWYFTLVATRPLNIVYFDGYSAAKMDYGSLDTQDLLVWGESSKENMWDETGRIERLCEWAVDLGVDALIRMEMGFEVMLCNFTSGVRLASSAKLRPGGLPPLMSGLVTFETMHAGSWHNYFPGETRIQLDLPRLISFYDTQLVPSLVPIRVGQERWDHRVGNISKYDLSIVKSKLEADLISPPIRSSGIDWQSLLHVLVDRFADRLELTRYLLTFPAAEPADIINFANKTQIQLRTMLAPYLLLPAAPSDPTDEAALDWTVPMYKSCATSHASFTESELDGMTESEALILRAVRGTNREICRVLTKMWAAGVYAGIDIKQNTKEVLDVVEITRLQSTWLDDLNGLMGWLDWSVWVKCDPGCSPEEMCFLPTWPFGFPLEGFPDTGLPYEVVITPDPNEWVRPHPRCIPRFEPFAF
ncbi:hypothetical protein JVU11DRAFT_4016 [Chiua virens]|nr:hypothetical protein JVU11DRAFT_4016 [Chiua virens]